MTQYEFLSACEISNKIDSIENAINYMETVHCSTECYNAIVDMLKYEKEGLINDFKKLSCTSTDEDITNNGWNTIS